MKKKSFRALSNCLCFGIFSISSLGWSMPQKIIETKEITRAFDVNSDATLTLDNQYGNINVHSWDQDKVEVNVEIKVEGRKRERVLEKLDEIQIVFSNSPEAVSVKTYLDDPQNNSSWFKFKWNFFDHDDQNFHINYTVKMPRTNQAIFYNEYGDVFIDELEGKASINCEYGKLDIGRLLHEENIIDLAYSSNSSIEYLKKGTIEVDYSGLEIGESEILDLNADYSRVQIDIIGKLGFNSDYGKLSLGSAEFIEGNGDYVSITIDEIHQSAEINLDYGALKIRSIHPDTQFIDINSDYAAIALGIDPSWSFDFEIETEYAGFKSDLRLDFLQKIKENEDSYYKGSFGSSTKKGKLNISSDYGKISLTQY